MQRGRYAGKGKPRGAFYSVVGSQNVPNVGLKQFTPRYSANVRRHQWTQATPTAEPATSTGLSAIAPDEYWVERCFRMQRTFDLTPNPDVEPTPSQSNNFRNTSVMNGSTVEDFDMVCRIKNTSATVSPTIDVYKMCFSFWEAYIFAQIGVTNSPISWNAGVDRQGEVFEKVPTNAIMNTDIIENFKFYQHNLEKVAEITIGNTDTDNVAEFRVKGVPSKVKRMQTGAYYAYVFHNSSDKNGGATWNFDYSVTRNFTEIPSAIRPPYLL